MLKRFRLLPRTLSRLAGQSRRRVVVVATMVLLYYLVPTLVDSLTIKQITVAGAWAQSTTAPDQESTAGEEEKITPAGEPEEAPAEGQGSAQLEEADQQEEVTEEEEGEVKEEEEVREDEEEEVKEEVEEEEGYIDRIHSWLSGGVAETAQRVDRFFGDPNYEVEATHTRLRLQFNTFFQEGEEADFRFRVNLRLVLPRTGKRVQLIVSGDSEEEEGDESDSGAVARTAGDDNVQASLAFIAVDNVKHNLSFRTGVKGGPAWWLGPRYRFYANLGPVWGFRFIQLLRWRTDDGWEFRSTFEFERKIGEDFFFRTRARGTYNQDDWDDEGYRYRLQAQLFQRVTPNIGFRYEWLNLFQTKPDNHLEEIIVSFGYRQRIWRKWLFFEIVPQASFPDDRDFEFVPGILFRIETFIGKRYTGKIK